MSSIIDYFNQNGLEYHASSLSSASGWGPERAFAKSGNCYCTTGDVPGQWWQVSFSKPVVISKYIITYQAGYSASALEWDISISNDDKTFDFVKPQTVTTICGNTEPYSLDSPVSCKHFRLTMNKPNSAGINDFFFYGFDCFGFVGTIKSPRRTRIKFSCNFARYKRNLIANNLLMILPSIINT